mmetsp:Transcript_60310/g.54317  ORF Transcript_60310/g.54317 Transcript_60310/m.54317 type:complete len:667 (+) Transcript_60310:63-2063(+)
MSNINNEDENDATSEQFTALLLRYLARRAEQAQRGAGRRHNQREGVISSPIGIDDDEEDDDEDASHSPVSGEDEDSGWGWSMSRRKKKSVPKLDLIDDTDHSNGDNDVIGQRKHAIGRLQQWIDDGQIKNPKHIQQYYSRKDQDCDDHDDNEEEEEDEEKKMNDYNNDQNVFKNKKRPLICNDNHYKSSSTFIPYNFQHIMNLREIGKCSMYNTQSRKGIIGCYSDHLFANNVMERFQGNSRVFCCDFSCDGNVLCAASQDHVIHLIDSRSGVNSSKWPIYKQVESQFSGWSIIDVALSPDHEFVAYSGWSSSIYLVNAYGSHELHEAHDLNISTFNSWGRCCVFGIEFDPNSKKVICALSGGCLILHDLERKLNEFSDPSAHEDDINQATFLDSNIIISGSDDALLRVWDARLKNKCIGGFVGHYQGITCVSTPNDYGSSNYVLSNSKDQSMKLWDLRCMNNCNELTSTRAQLQPSTGSFDYRYRGWNPQSSSTHKKRFRIDKSLITYRGHSVSRTLCRSGFSPVHSTNAKYVYCGSSDCTIYIYETLTAKLVHTLSSHSDIVRDVCWHPYLPMIVSASWDGSVVRWSYKGSNKDGSIRQKSIKNRQSQQQQHINNNNINNINNDNDAFTDSGSDSEDDQCLDQPKPVCLDMPEHLRKRNDYDYW